MLVGRHCRRDHGDHRRPELTSNGVDVGSPHSRERVVCQRTKVMVGRVRIEHAARPPGCMVEACRLRRWPLRHGDVMLLILGGIAFAVIKMMNVETQAR